VTVPNCCPHCDSKKIDAMAARSYEAISAMTWYQCRECQRMWSLPKPPPTRPEGDNEHSPESSGRGSEIEHPPPNR
jgi:hypothetical protein